MFRLPPFASTLVVLATLSTTTAYADTSLFDERLNARALSVGESLRADARGTTAATQNPAGIALTREVVFEGGYSYRTDDVQVFSATACDSTVAMPACYYYRHVRSDISTGSMSDATGHEAGIALGRRITQQLSLGINARYVDLSGFDGMTDASGFSFDVGLVARLTSSMNLAAVGYNLWGERSSKYPRALATGLSFIPNANLSLGFDASWNLDQDNSSAGRFGGGIEYFLNGEKDVGYPLRIGGVYDSDLNTTSLTGGLGITAGKLGVDLAMSRELRGGDELAVIANLRVYGPRMAAQKQRWSHARAPASRR